MAGEARLARLWRLLAESALGVAACIALLLVTARAPYLGAWLPSLNWFRTGLVLHVDLAVLVWLLASCARRWSLSSAPHAGMAGWPALLIAASAAGALLAVALLGSGEAHLSNYLPFLASTPYLAALLAFAIAVLATYAHFLVRPGADVGARLPLALTGVPLVCALVSLAWSAHDLRGIDARSADLLTWGAGHTLLLGYVCAMMLAWLDLARADGVQADRRLVHLAFLLQALPALAVPLIHLGAPIGEAGFRDAFTGLMRWSSWPGAALLAVALIHARRRAHGCPMDAGLVLSLLLFGVGLLLGAAIRDDSSVVPAHYHATVGAVTVALMRGAAGTHAARRAGTLVYGMGILVLALALAWAGGHGVSRKAPLLSHPLTGLAQQLGMAVVAAGGALAIAGVLAFVAPAWRSALGQAGGQLRHWAARGRDRRPLGIGVTLAIIVVAGAAIALAPRSLDALARPQDHQTQVRVQFDEAVALMRRGELERASIALHAVLVLAPQMPEAHANMGFVMLGLGRAQNARAFFESAAALRPLQDNAYYGLAVAHETLGDLPAAIGAMRTFVHLAAPSDPFVRKGQAALWEWEAKTAAQRSPAPAKERSR